MEPLGPSPANDAPRARGPPALAVALVGGSTNFSSYFGDPRWTNYPARFYRLDWP